MSDWILSLIPLLIGAYLVVMNWIIAYQGIFRQKHASSVPILGGLMLAVGLATLPTETPFRFWWLPFLIDWGCVPMFVYAAWAHATGKFKS